MSKYRKRKAVYDVPSTPFETWVANIWLIAVIVFVPLVFHNYYYDILPFKYHFLLCANCLAFAALVLRFFMSENKTESENLVDSIKAKLNSMNFVEQAVLIFIIIYTVSTLTAGRYMRQAFMGNEGRYNGLLLMGTYAILYFLLKGHIKFHRHMITLFLIAGLLICLFGITDYFSLDILKFKVQMSRTQVNDFTSTIGNINTYTTYVGQVIAVSGTLFMLSPADVKKTKGEGSILRLLFYYLCMSLGFMALAMGKSDNGYLTLGAFFGFLPFVVWKTRRGFRRYLITLATYFSVIKIIGIINLKFAGQVIGIYGLYQYIAEFKYMTYAVVFLWAAALIAAVIDYKTSTEGAELTPVLRWLWLGVLLLIIFFTGYLFYKANTDSDFAASKLGAAKEYFVFNDSWGTNRGYIWRAALEEYFKLSPIHKIFGSGPETFGIYMMALRYEDMVVKTSQVFDNVHNEYIQFLFTIGPFGLLAYLIMTLGTAYICLKSWFKKLVDEEEGRYLVAAAFMIVCYAAQATVNLYIPITSCLVWAFMILSAGMLKKVKFPPLFKVNKK
jgi:hypothetical protein